MQHVLAVASATLLLAGGAEAAFLGGAAVRAPRGASVPRAELAMQAVDQATGQAAVEFGLDVAGQKYGTGRAVPMPAMGGLNDQQVAAVLSYVRMEFGESAPEISAEFVKKIRAKTAGRVKPWTAEELH